MSRQVNITGNVAIAVLMQPLSQRLLLVESMFHEQPAAGLQMLSTLLDDDFDGFKPLCTGLQRQARLKAEVSLEEVRITRPDVWWIGDD